MRSTQGFLDVAAEEVFICIRTKDGMEMKYKIENPRQVGLGFNCEVERGGYSMSYALSSNRELQLKINY